MHATPTQKNKRILVNTTRHLTRVAVVNESVIDDFYCEKPGQDLVIGNVYKAKVEAVIPGIGAAFVDIGYEKNGFLYLNELLHADEGWEALDTTLSKGGAKNTSSLADLKKNTDVMVQLVKAPYRTKGPGVTTRISLAGRFLVLLPGGRARIRVSKRIPAQEKKNFVTLFSGMKNLAEYDIILRTASHKAHPHQIKRELHYLISTWQKIKAKFARQTSPSVVHRELDLTLRITRDLFDPETSEVVVDSKVEYIRIMRFLRLFAPELRRKVKFYKDGLPLFDRYNVESQVQKLLTSRVELKHGGFIVIESTEGVVSIDVNTGRFIGQMGKHKRLTQQETAYLTNMDAAREIPRQLRLRNLSGIIIIDFIDMSKPEHKKSVISCLEEFLRHDKAKTDVLRISELGLIEMTRERKGKSLDEFLCEACPYCHGKGKVKSHATMAEEIKKHVMRYLHAQRRSHIQVLLNPQVADFFLKNHSSDINELKRRYHSNITVAKDALLHFEEIKIA